MEDPWVYNNKCWYCDSDHSDLPLPEHGPQLGKIHRDEDPVPGVLRPSDLPSSQSGHISLFSCESNSRNNRSGSRSQSVSQSLNLSVSQYRTLCHKDVVKT